MSAANLLTQARVAGIILVLDPPEGLKVRGDPEALARWAPILKPHKRALIGLLSEPRRTWNVTEPDGTRWTSSFAPMQTMGDVLIRYAPGTVAVPVLDPDQGEPLPADVEALVLAWLDALGETDPRTRAEVLQRARDVPEARADCLARARPGTPQGPNHEGTDPSGTRP